MVNDNAKEMTGKEWTTISRKICIEYHNTEEYHPNKNLYERRLENFSDQVIPQHSS